MFLPGAREYDVGLVKAPLLLNEQCKSDVEMVPSSWVLNLRGSVQPLRIYSDPSLKLSRCWRQPSNPPSHLSHTHALSSCSRRYGFGHVTALSTWS